MEEEGSMDFHSIKRKQLQSLCKKHGVPANLSNREMADRLSLIFKKNEKIVSKGDSLVEKSSKKVSESISNAKVATKVVKKVRFSPVNETFLYEVSGYKRGGRRSTRKSLPKNEIMSAKSDVESDVSGGLGRRRLRTGKVVAEKRSVRQRGSKKAKIEDTSESGAVQEQCGNAPPFDGIRKGKGRNATQKSVAPQKRRAGSEILAGYGAEQDKFSRQTTVNVTKNENSDEMLIENSRKVEVSRRNTRSQAKILGKASEEETVLLEEPSKNQGRYASRQESVASKKRRVGSRALVEDGAGQDKVLHKTEQNVTKDRDSELSIGNSRAVEVSKRRKRSQVKIAGKASAAESRTEEKETVQHEKPSEDLSRYASRRKSVVPQKGKAETDGLQDKKETRQRWRNTNSNLEAASKSEAVVKPIKKIEKVENVSVPSGPSMRTRRSTVMFMSSVSTVGKLETHQTVEETRKRTRKAMAESSKEIEKVENASVPSCPSRRTRRNTKMFTSSASTDGELETHQSVRVEDACLSKGHQRRSSRNASRSNPILTNSKLEGIANGVGKGKQQKQRQKQIIDEEISTSKCLPLAENPPRRSSRVASKGDLVEPAGPTNKVVGKKRHGRSRMAVIEESPSVSVLAPKEPLIDDARLAVSEAERTENNLDASYSKQLLESSKKKKKTYKGQFEVTKQLGSVEVSTVYFDIKEATNLTVNSEETSPADQSNKFNRKGDFGHVSLVELEVTEMNNEVSNVISPEITSPAVGSSPANQSDNLTEPSNILAFENAIEAEEPSTGKYINNGSDNADYHSNKEDRTLVQEHQTLVQLEDAEETAETVILEALLEENRNELSERSSEKKFEIPLEETEEISVINPSDEQGSSHTEDFLEAVEMLEIATESNPIIGESSALRTAEMQLSAANGGNATEATPSRPALETEGFDYEVNNDPDHTLIANNVDMKEGVCNAEAQNVFQSTELERGNAQSIGEEEFSGNRMEISDKIICIGESSVCNAQDGLSGHARTRDNVTTNKIQPEDTFSKERISQVLGEKITEDNAIMGSVKRNDGDAMKKENEVPELYAQDAVESENEASEQNPNNFSKENGGRCMHEPLNAEEIDLISTDERGTDVVKDTSVASIDLQSPFTGDKEICPELALRENDLINDEHETVSDIGTNKLSSSRARLSVHNDLQDKLNAKVNEDAMDVLMAEVQTEPLSPLALEKLQNSMEGDTQDASNSFGKVFCQPTGDCNSGSRTEVQDRDLVGDKCSSASTREIDGKGFNGELGVKQCADVAKEKNPECALKVELDKNVHNLETKDIGGMGFDGESEVEECADVVKEENADCVSEVELGDKNYLEGTAPRVNDSAGASLKEIIVKESEFSDDKGVEIMISPNECIDRVDMLKMEQSNLKNRNSDAVVMDVGAPSQVIVNHVVEMEGADMDDSFVQNSEIATNRQTGTETIKSLLAEVDNGGTSVGVSPIIPGKAFRNKFTEINDTAPGTSNEIISAPCEDLEEKSMEVLPLGLVQHVDEVKFDNLKDSMEENVLELERICFITSDRNDTDADRKANVEKMAGDSNFNFNSSDDVKEDSIDAIPQVSTNDIDDHLLEVEFHNAGDSDHNVMLDDAGVVSVVGDIDSENVGGNKWVQKTPTFSQTIENRRKLSMKNSAKSKCVAYSSFAKPEIGSNTDAVSRSKDIPSLGVTENKSLELHVDFPQYTSPEVKMILMVGEQIEVEKSAGGNQEANLITRDHEEALEVKGNPTNDEQVNQQVTEKQLGEQENQIHLTVLDEPLEITRDLDDSLEVKESVTINEQVNHQITEKQLGEQESESHLSVSGEHSEMTRDCDDSLEGKENVTTDEHVTKNQLGEQENQSHLTVSDEPIHDDEETNEQNELSAINQESNDDDIHKDSSHVSAERVMLKDANQTSGRNVDDSDMFSVEHCSHDSIQADTVALDSVVPNFSGSKGVAADQEVNIEGVVKMDMPEVENGGELCTDKENPEEASPGIAGTVLQQIFSSSSGWEEKNISGNRLSSDAFSEYEFSASSSASYLYDLAFCNEMQVKDSSKNAGGEMVDDEDRGKSYRDVALHFQENKDSSVRKGNTTESLNVENKRTDTQEIVEEQLGEDEGNRNGAAWPDNNKSKSHVVEADGLRRIDDVVVTAGDSKEIADFDSLTGTSSPVPEMVVDCSAVSPVFDFSNSVESDIFTACEISLFSGPGEQDEIENSDAGALKTCLISQDAGEVKENAATVEQVQLSEHETTEEVANFNSTLLSDFVESMCEGGEGSKEQEPVLDMKHGTPDHKNPKNESLKLKRIDSAPGRDAAAGDPWRLELDLLSAPKKSPDVKSVKASWLARKTNSSMKMNSSVRKLSNRSSLIQRTPKQLVHDMKENVVSTKREFSNITAHKTATKRRALEDLPKI